MPSVNMTPFHELVPFRTRTRSQKECLNALHQGEGGAGCGRRGGRVTALRQVLRVVVICSGVRVHVQRRHALQQNKRKQAGAGVAATPAQLQCVASTSPRCAAVCGGAEQQLSQLERLNRLMLTIMNTPAQPRADSAGPATSVDAVAVHSDAATQARARRRERRQAIHRRSLAPAAAKSVVGSTMIAAGKWEPDEEQVLGLELGCNTSFRREGGGSWCSVNNFQIQRTGSNTCLFFKPQAVCI